MPTYEYRCKSCKHDFERIQKISDDSVVECPECGEETERLISGGAGLLFKGSGFYITDYRSDSYKEAAAGDKKSGESAKSDKATKAPSGKGEAKSSSTDTKRDASKGSAKSKPTPKD